MENEIMRYESQIKISPASIGKINEQFALVDILLCYAEKNRNKTSMSKSAIESNLYSLYGCPIVGERIIKDDGSEDFGTHGGKIIIDDSGIKFEQTTKALGFITKDAVDNAKWVTITEKDGHTKHDYLQLKGCVVWQERFEEVKDLLEKDYSQSMEIAIKKSHYDDENYLVIDDFVFTAACILGSDVEPCFESACIGRHYELDNIKNDLDIMKSVYDKFRNDSSKNKQKEERTMDLTKFTTLLSDIKYGDNCEKFSIMGANENNIFVIDREDLKLYSVCYAETEESGVIINWDTKKEADIAYSEKSRNDDVSVFSTNFNNFVKDYIKDYTSKLANEYDKKLESQVKTISDDAESRFNEMKDNYTDLQNSYSVIKEKLDKFEKIEAEKNKENHIAAAQKVLEKFEAKIGKTPEFIYYKAKVDCEKVDIDTMEKELTLMTGDILMNKKSDNKTFSYTPTMANVINSKNKNNDTASRYGTLLDSYLD